MKLNKPTVADVIRLLQTMPQDAPFRIEDADTEWEISIIHVDQDGNGKVWFSGDYIEMQGGD